jgi:hypothetical protein
MGPLADRCGPVGDVKRCESVAPVSSSDKPWKAAFESVVPASGAAVVAVTGPVASPEQVLPTAVAPLPATVAKQTATPKAARRSPVKAKEQVPVRRTAQESSEGERERSGSESEESKSDIEDE